MINRDTRMAVLALASKSHGVRKISKDLQISRNTVRKILRLGTADVPEFHREDQAQPYHEEIALLYLSCAGNLVRVQEELQAKGISLAYSTLTAHCRRTNLAEIPVKLAGQYHFEPGQEMQHDTSPHKVEIAQKRRLVQCASLVLCYSRRIYAQVFPVWNRFWAKVFLTDALVYFGGAADQCMVDNSSVILAGGSGKQAIIAPEMLALGNRFSFHFVAHELGDKDRSARVERPFFYIESNFYPGRVFTSVDDLNAQLLEWCEKVDSKPKKTIQARPLDLFVTESPALHPLPLHVPNPYLIHKRRVDDEGYIQLHSNRYSVPMEALRREITVHETRSEVRLFDGHKLLCEHTRLENGGRHRVTLQAHRNERERWRHTRQEPELRPWESTLCAQQGVVAEMYKALRNKYGTRGTRIVHRLYRFWMDYPQAPLEKALSLALSYGLLDLDRIEKLILRHIAGDFFRLPDLDGDIPTLDPPEDPINER